MGLQPIFKWEPPWGRYTPPPRRYTALRYTPWGRYTPTGIPLQVTPQQEHLPQSSACWEIWATSGRYASYWNAFLFSMRTELLGSSQSCRSFDADVRCKRTLSDIQIILPMNIILSRIKSRGLFESKGFSH